MQALIRKLERFRTLSPTDQDFLQRICQESVQHLSPREDIIREGDPPTVVRVFLEGWAFRYKMLEDGRRQILAIILPGDFCDLNIFMLKQLDHSIAALTPITLARISAATYSSLEQNHPDILGALWQAQLVENSIQREWLLNLGQRTAVERVAHLLCELFFRLRAVGLASDEEHCELPLTQTDLGNATGLSAVHVNRTLQTLRGLGLIVLKGRSLEIPRLSELADLAMFNPAYLHVLGDAG